MTLLELMVVIVIIALIAALSMPAVTSTLRSFRAQDGVKAVVNSIHSARARAAIMNKALAVRITSSDTIGAENPVGGGGQIQVFKYAGVDCNGSPTPLVPDPGNPAVPLAGDGRRWDNYQFSELKDIGICFITTEASAEVICASINPPVSLCVKPNGEITNPPSNNDATIVYVREYRSGSTPLGTVNTMQVVIPRNRPARLNAVPVTVNACL